MIFLPEKKNAKKTKTNAETICSGPMGVEYEILLDGNGCLHMLAKILCETLRWAQSSQ